jgi:hypothetical protein
MHFNISKELANTGWNLGNLVGVHHNCTLLLLPIKPMMCFPLLLVEFGMKLDALSSLKVWPQNPTLIHVWPCTGNLGWGSSVKSTRRLLGPWKYPPTESNFISDWRDSFIGPSGLLLLVSPILAVQFPFDEWGWKKKVSNWNLDVRNNLARSHTERWWRCSQGMLALYHYLSWMDLRGNLRSGLYWSLYQISEYLCHSSIFLMGFFFFFFFFFFIFFIWQ